MVNTKIKITGNVVAFKNLKEADIKPIIKEEVDNIDSLVNRPEMLSGNTYKIKSPLLDSSMYVVINNIEDDGKLYPFEIFIHSKEVIYQQWIHITNRLISAIFRMAYTYKVDSSFVVSELKAIHSATGSYFKKGKVITSVVSEIGEIVQEHLERIKYAKPKTQLPEYIKEKIKEVEKDPTLIDKLEQCSECGSRSVIKMDGCSSCLDCGFSKCG